ncbi:bifunctional serine/threonine-protein kinase/ABC transporter substrate-binding protein [Streptomyces prunicolor]|uniref:bifunctional serine/threonine-protein kinase/ABC transporter substrate-binding protein n=1 Tax=Streptomyces prunicolor TaxID=67348 RepID=UPI002257D70E|nr:bifunctional serine/threonine-protein kinase/ABC transporter substrate-binding protein [Streptomyces prunicolor]MCX5242749.1 bifunctional serine/threonine-protein kinase/ABC transporter substrate-binding protein [Streptomyces prunicolor]
MSEPLRSSDPSRIAGFRLLRRLGAGGMGVVYLGRTDSGALAAVKVIRGEGAGDDGFRARFAREVELARRVDSPWVVPVLDADAEAREPWLATVFVPGPSVAEAVAAHGPLPSQAVRVLGGLLAQALDAVHTAGLVHRDVKPGNVLLALDGPRLIDFGIARATDDTALTASGLVVGTPGFLAPEQAEGQPATSASDVFALGCVLAYASTGTPPFGTGTPDALVYRTVHDEPELGRVEGELRSLVERCLAKDPAARPTADGIRGLLADDAPDASGGWLPDSVARMVAARSAESLAFPDVEPTVVDDPAVPTGHPGRRRLLLAGSALLLAGGGTGAAVWASGDDEKPSTGVGRPVYVLGVHTTTGTAEAAVSRASERAARLAVAQHNATPKRSYDLKVKVLADRGDADTAREVARTFTADRDVVAVLGPVAELPMQRAAAVYGAAGLTHVSSSTGQQDYFLTSPRTSFQSGPAHAALGGWIGLHAYITQQVVSAGVVIDRAGGSAMQDEGTQVVGNWRNILKSEVVPRVVAEDTDDGPKAVRELLAAGVKAFVYLGALDATVRTARSLATARFTGPRWMQHQLYGSDFPRLAGAAGEGWYVVTDAADPSVLTTKRAKDFTAAWRKRYGSTPEPYATEAYDSAGMLLAEFARTVPAGARRRPVRADLAVRLAKVKYQGIARTYAFGDFHQYDNSSTGWADETFVHEVRGGRFRQLGSLGDLHRAAQSQG